MSERHNSMTKLTEAIFDSFDSGKAIQLPEDITTVRSAVKGDVPCFIVYNVPNGSLNGVIMRVFVNDNEVTNIAYNDEGGVRQNHVNLSRFLREGQNDLRLVTAVFGIGFFSTASITVLSDGSTIIDNTYRKSGGFGADVIDQHWQLDFTP